MRKYYETAAGHLPHDHRFVTVRKANIGTKQSQSNNYTLEDYNFTKAEVWNT